MKDEPQIKLKAALTQFWPHHHNLSFGDSTYAWVCINKTKVIIPFWVIIQTFYFEATQAYPWLDWSEFLLHIFDD